MRVYLGRAGRDAAATCGAPRGRAQLRVLCRQATRTGTDVRSNGRSASAARETGRPGNGSSSASGSAAAGNGRSTSRSASRPGSRPASRSASRGRGRGAELNGAGNGNGRSVSPGITEREAAGEASGDPAENPRINLIERSRWEDGVPPVMGAHLMPSGVVAPISMTKGPGIGDGHLFFYPDEKKQQVVTQYLNADAGGDALAKQIHEIARKAVATKGGFTLAVSGGSLLTALEHLASEEARFDKWHVAYVDERNVPHASGDSNHRGARKAFLSKIDVPRAQVYAIKEGLGVAEAAKQYEGQLLGIPVKVLPRTPDGFPVFDVVLLGVGPDGHVASLFPNRKETAAQKGWVLPVSASPKPPPERITLSMPVINSGRHVYVVAFGKGKAEIVQRAMEVQSLPGALPVQLVNPASGSLQWMLDCEAASQLNITKWESARDFPRSERE